MFTFKLPIIVADSRCMWYHVYDTPHLRGLKGLYRLDFAKLQPSRFHAFGVDLLR
jgi:hypothetical protein